MARKTTSKRVVKTVPGTSGSPSRDFVLAGIGAVSLGRKQAIASYQSFGQNAADFSERVGDSIRSFETSAKNLRKQAETKVVKLRKQAEAKVVKLRKQAQAQIVPVQNRARAVASEVRAQAEARLAPVLGRFGIKAAQKKRAVKRAPTRKAAGKRTRKAA
jgi:hypothetical protein